jgi:hypothetical protein
MMTELYDVVDGWCYVVDDNRDVKDVDDNNISNVNVDYTSMMFTTWIMTTDDNRLIILIIVIIYMKSLGMSIQGWSNGRIW